MITILLIASLALNLIQLEQFYYAYNRSKFWKEMEARSKAMGKRIADMTKGHSHSTKS